MGIPCFDAESMVNIHNDAVIKMLKVLNILVILSGLYYVILLGK